MPFAGMNVLVSGRLFFLEFTIFLQRCESSWLNMTEKYQNVPNLLYLSFFFKGLLVIVKDSQGEPIRSALLTVQGFRDRFPVTSDLALVKLWLPQGSHEINVSAPNYEEKSVIVDVIQKKIGRMEIVLTARAGVVPSIDTDSVNLHHESTGIAGQFLYCLTFTEET